MQNVLLENHNSRLILNLEKGAQIEELLLEDNSSDRLISVILPYNKEDNFFLSGNFLMYPWVNRLKTKQIKVGEKQISIEPLASNPEDHPIHGLYFNKPRKVIEIKKNFVKLEPASVNSNFPHFTESFTLEENSLLIRTDFYNTTKDIQEFAYGYHPYLRLNANIENCEIHTNLTDYIPLTPNFLPNQNLEKRNISEIINVNTPIGKLKLDHLLTGSEKDLFFGIIDKKENMLLQIRVSGDSLLPLPYFQVYTPDVRNSIAIEPMSATGNAFFLPNSGLQRLNPNENTFGEFIIELSKIK